MEDLPQFPELAVMRDAWAHYLRCSFAVGMFDGKEGEDLRSRLAGRDDEQFRSAMSECFAAWFLSERLGLTVSPRPKGRQTRVLDMAVRCVEGDTRLRNMS